MLGACYFIAHWQNPKNITPQTTIGQTSGAELSWQAFDKSKRVIVGGLPVGKLGE